VAGTVVNDPFSIVQTTTVPDGEFGWISNFPQIIRAR
jgi:hypothetical protein